MVLFVLGVTLLLMLAVLLIPFNIHIKSKKTGPDIKAHIDFLWLFSTLKLRFNIIKQIFSIHIFNKKLIQKKISKRKKEKNTNKIKKIKKKKETFSINLFPPIFKLAKKLIHTFSIKKAHIKLNIGFSNKAETGII
ncbi:MAG: hypothetical protein KAS12_01995, partial [Candidatus Aenigmarchaeota archaeon]|nr:hypothetical protein [Candidatus Aenigmarchaeota archaeon]